MKHWPNEDADWRANEFDDSLLTSSERLRFCFCFSLAQQQMRASRRSRLNPYPTPYGLTCREGRGGRSFDVRDATNLFC